MKFINFAIVKFAFFLVSGILTAHFFPISTFILPYIFLLFVGVVIFWFWARKQLIQNLYFGIITYLCFFSIGYTSYQMCLSDFKPGHYSTLNLSDSPELIELKIKQVLKPDRFNLKYIAAVKAVNTTSTQGKILLYLSKDSLQQTLQPDTVILVHASISDIQKPLNPHQFDYSNYMKMLGVFGAVRVSNTAILKKVQGRPTLKGAAQKLRKSIIAKLRETKLKTDERAIIQALVLGEKKDIDQRLYKEYAAAGAVHILAVSGLHVGIIYIILAFLLKPLSNWKYGKFLHVILIVLLLWGFALLSGLSPSVTRAVTMFSFFALATLFNRETNSINTLFLSFLTLLIINPFLLFQVGFQLSYLAVFFILWMQPQLFKFGYSKYWLLRKTWAIITVTLCAQIGVLPLSLYYFHQFPGLFLLTNIVVLPFLTILMCGGILIVVLALLNSLPDWIAEGYNTMLEGLNAFIHWVAIQDKFLITDISFSELKLMGTYLLIITLVLFFKKAEYRNLVFALLSVSGLIAISIYDEYRTSGNHLVVFHKSKQTLLGHQSGSNLTIFTNDSNETVFETYPIQSFKIERNIRFHTMKKLPYIFRYKNKKRLILDSLGVIPKQKNIYTVLLTHSPKVNLNRLIDSLAPAEIIADGSNYHSYVNRWQETCKLKKLPFYHTAKHGALSIK
ncbi:ComEC/Rec2 family competence protein [Aequorivita marina]|uniref:ComEC/Rec2 family competence protein n=1 Tax=Aequorivita marina TaxID=3073654 RepID=UPI0028760BF8|nr:ComEC/Rec2 family competence protein [Aequorivita sp. S2608]MDS1296887.1 ComEC/Rec2 family competence protein [Aequorivita sp. S2608]